MATLLFTIGSAVLSALAFSGTNSVFSQLTDHGEEERKRHYLAEEQLQKARDAWNKDRTKWLDFINKRLRERNKAWVYINNVNEVLSSICKKNKPLTTQASVISFLSSIRVTKKW